MSIKAKSSLIRKYRTQRMWSQEQLAEACGLGLRTIQRVEARGHGSLDTIKAVAAVFEVSADTLIWKDGDFKIYRHKQWSFVTFIAMPIVAACVLVLDNNFNSIPTAAIGVLFGVLTIVTVIMSSMTIEVNESDVRWHFGPGVFHKSLPLEEIAKCKSVKNPIWMGFGIHAFGTGWIYNVSGLLGIEIELKGGAFIRLGSDEPNYLVSAIEDAISNLS